jgi:hypothetical protein
MNDRLQPALWGGVFIGVLSALPLVSAGNCCCCLWVLIGGALAAYLRQQNTPFQVTAAEGALVGLIAGAIGGVIQSVLSIPFEMMAGPMQQQIVDRVLSSNPDVDPQVREMMENLAAHSAGFRVIGMLITVCVFTVFGLFGGLLGVAIFKKNLPPPPPPGTIDIPPSSIPPPSSTPPPSL